MSMRSIWCHLPVSTGNLWLYNLNLANHFTFLSGNKTMWSKVLVQYCAWIFCRPVRLDWFHIFDWQSCWNWFIRTYVIRYFKCNTHGIAWDCQTYERPTLSRIFLAFAIQLWWKPSFTRSLSNILYIRHDSLSTGPITSLDQNVIIRVAIQILKRCIPSSL